VTIAVPSESAPRVTGPTPDPITYRFVNYRVLTCAIFIPLGLGGIAMFVNLLAGGTGPPAVFVFLWLAAYGWGVYWCLFRVAYEVGVVNGSTLRWRTIMKTREIQLARITAIQTPYPPFGFGFKRVVVDGDRSPLIVANQGYRDVVAMIVQFHPDLIVPDTWYDRFFERFAHRSVRWRRV